MAGESPDKTEQRKSSSGTAAEERDPRFAVFRAPDAARDGAETDDAGSGAGTGSGTGSGATSDTATAVFRPRLPEDETRREPEAEAASGDEPEAVTDAGPDADPDGVPGSGSAPQAVSAASDAAGEPVEAPEGPEAAQDRTSADTGVEEPDAGAERPDGEKPDGGVKQPDVEASEGDVEVTEGEASAKEPAEEPEPESADGDGEGDGRLRAAVAAWVGAEAEDKPDAVAGDGPDSEAGDDADAGAKPMADDPVADDEGVAEGDEAAPSATAERRAEPEAASVADAKSPSDPQRKPDRKSERSEPEDEQAGKTEQSEEEPGAKADGKPDAGAAPDADDKPKAGSAPDADDKPEAGTAPDRASDAEADSGDASDLRGIDQPTAVFKALKPGGTTGGVDQATTALKLPRDTELGTEPGARPGGRSAEPGSATEPGSAPESDAERTSTFVPLRSDDVRAAPAPRKPEPEAGGGDTADAGPGASARTPEAAAPPPAAPSWAAAERTRQQPLPPKPPLDLLAELTNTPPPPETPVRTAVRRVKIWTPLVLLLLIVFAIVQVMRPLPEPSLELTAKPTYTFEGGATKLAWPGQGQSAVMVDGVGSLGTEGAQKPAPIASVAKAMTAYVILEGHPLKGDEEGEKITVDQKAEDESKRPDESTAPLTKGQQLTQRQMLQLLMIPSGNNAARLLARWDAGSEDAFIDKMNDAAKDLGMTNSTYTDPSGLEKTTVSTATDQLKLAQAVMRNEVFRKIVDTPEVEIEGIDGKIYNNNNLLLQPGVSGIKTGSSTPAGGNLLWSANTKVDGKLLWIYGAVMGQQAGTGRVYDSLELSLQNSLKLIKDAQEAATSATVVKKGDVVGYVDNGFGGQTPVVATKNLKAVGWSGLEVELKVTDNGKGIGHEAKAGSEVGMVTVGTGTGKMTAPVVLQGDLVQPAFGDKLARIG
ncbi:serine hydrolase [Streptomyces sp. V2I9]|uniref:serine hydrolase n=1 Tax=Streptomyces sp. V2I9 TaxID=3042304 RepID=UPI00278048A2|nr:serine hydrolase [Streptomyces sp. V2I9]MDQ0985071.1 D-alanyl-D-alanine carboxypeptidase (penicillin-binding protein 5/6) [Streptomyces sp. V2I9]